MSQFQEVGPLMNTKRWILAGSVPVLLLLVFSTTQTKKFQSRVEYQSRTEAALDDIYARSDARDYGSALQTLQRHTTLAVERLEGKAYSADERGEFFRQWLDVAKVYKAHGRQLGLNEKDLNANLAGSVNEILSARVKDSSFKPGAAAECKNLFERQLAKK